MQWVYGRKKKRDVRRHKWAEQQLLNSSFKACGAVLACSVPICFCSTLISLSKKFKKSFIVNLSCGHIFILHFLPNPVFCHHSGTKIYLRNIHSRCFRTYPYCNPPLKLDICFLQEKILLTHWSVFFPTYCFWVTRIKNPQVVEMPLTWPVLSPIDPSGSFWVRCVGDSSFRARILFDKILPHRK